MVISTICAIVSPPPVITVNNPIHPPSFPTFTYSNTSLYLVLCEADSIGIPIPIVYIGALSIPSPSISMLLNISQPSNTESIIQMVPIVTLIILIPLILIPHPLALWGREKGIGNVSNVVEIGLNLYGTYHFHFIGLSIILLVALYGIIQIIFEPRIKLEPKANDRALSQNLFN